MFKDADEALRYVKDNDIRMVVFKIVDLAGRWHHLSIPAARLSKKTFSDGIGFDGSSYGFAVLEKSDMIFRPDPSTAFLDPFCDEPTLSMIGDIYEIGEQVGRYASDPRYIAEKAEAYLAKTGIADRCILGPEFEFYVFDQAAYRHTPNHSEYFIDTEEAEWNSGNRDEWNSGYKVPHHGGYHLALPHDVTHNLRSQISLLLEDMGCPVKYHHHEVGGPGQVEIEVELGGLRDMADRSMLLKYVVRNAAVAAGKTATFMPKPIEGEAGNGMHVHFQLFNGSEPVFYDATGYSGLSKTALYAIGGLLKHSPALLGLTNPSTNSYKRLVPGYEAPVSICFATANRSSVIRVPGYATQPEKKRFEFRPSDATTNPYLAYAALLMAALDGITNQIDPTAEGFGPYDVNVFDLPESERMKIKALPKSLDEAADALEADHAFLLAGGVFSEELIRTWLRRIRSDARKVGIAPHPLEYKLYYDL
ncbi:MAG: type I glutamate--ammonia ligase [Chloroflexota bacterium]